MATSELLTPTQRSTLEALVDRLIPTDEAPGGSAAGVGAYIVRQLAGDLNSQVAVYRSGLAGLDAEARHLAGQPFDQLSHTAQDEILRRVAQGDVAATWDVEPARFLHEAAEHAAEGFYSDPGNGGNVGAVSWAMIGFRVTG
jgi:hypothetical protein